METKKTICMWCHAHCRVAVYGDNGRLVKIEEDPEHPHASLSASVVRSCRRARAAAEWFYHPERLKYPVKRKGARGENKWEPISWERGLNEVAERLGQIKSKSGAEALAGTSGTYRTTMEYAARFFNLFGSPNIIGGAANVCHIPANEVACATFGRQLNFTPPRPRTKCVLLIGANWEQSGVALWKLTVSAQEAGAKIIVVDPRRTGSAERADIWLQLRPATDTALLLAMINVIIREELFDAEFVGRWCYGFDDLKERVKPFTPEKAAEITWVPAEKIREAARLYATSKPAVSHHMLGLEQQPYAIDALRARYILPAITGNLDVKDGEMLQPRYPNLISEYEMELNDALPEEKRKLAIGTENARLFSWEGYEAVQRHVRKLWGSGMPRHGHCTAHGPSVLKAILSGQPYPVRTVITANNNPLITWANVKRVYQALKALDLYVVVDNWLTPSAQLADYVFPQASWMERPFIHSQGDSNPRLEVGEQALPNVVAGEYERWTDYDFWRGLGIRLAQEKWWPWKNLEESLDYRLKPTGFTLKEFMAMKHGFDRMPVSEKRYTEAGFGTPTGKVELRSTIFEKLGFDPLPNYIEPPESAAANPELAKEYPFILITGGRFQPMYHSEFRHIESCRSKRPYPLVQIHPDAASKLDIREDDWVWIETRIGRVRQKAQLSKGIDPRVVHAEVGWWYPELPGEEPWLHGVWESNINVVTDDDVAYSNKEAGGWPLRGVSCKIYRAKTY